MVKRTAVMNTAIKEAEKHRALVRKASDEYMSHSFSRSISSTDCYLDSCWKCQESKDTYKRWRGDEGEDAGKVCGHAHG